jgi:alpha-N-arabinofuranosidase
MSLAGSALAAESYSASLTLQDKSDSTISRHIYGHFSEHLGRCIYDGIWVGEDSPIPNTRGIRNDVVDALRAIKIPNLRWPGGCFADYYHWMEGIGPVADRPRMLNAAWGAVEEDNSFGTHEFMDLIDLLDTEPYICGNVGSGTPKEMSDWIEYLTLDGDTAMASLRKANGREEPWKVKYWAVGNESWGCGGNMEPEYYADLYKRYATFTRDYSGNRLYKVACGEDLKWNEVIMQNIPLRMMNGLSIHHYTLPGGWRDKKSATNFEEDQWIECLDKALDMEKILTDNETMMDKYDPRKRVALIVDEWGTWFQNEPGTNPGFLYQQNTIRDALVAGLTLNIFNVHCERVHMANIAQTVNVLQAMVLTEGDKMLLTPTYHVFEMYKGHQEATLIPIDIQSPTYAHAGREIPALSVSASMDSTGKVLFTACNLNPNESIQLECDVQKMGVTKVEGRILTADTMQAHNTFDDIDHVGPAPYKSAKLKKGVLSLVLPSKSVVALELLP